MIYKINEFEVTHLRYTLCWAILKLTYIFPKKPHFMAPIIAAAGLMFSMVPWAWSAFPQSYPMRPIRVIVPYPVGGGADWNARLVSKKMAESLGRTLVVDNRPGGSGVIGFELLRGALPDGYTLGLLSSSHSLLAATDAAMPVTDIVKHVSPIANFSTHYYVLASHASLPVSNLADLVAFAKLRPGQLNIGTSGGISVQRMAAEQLMTKTGIKLVQVSYRGGSAAISDLVAGRTQLQFAPLLTAREHAETRRIRMIAITAKTRQPQIPDVPTIEESGITGYEASQWYGWIAPREVDEKIISSIMMSTRDALSKAELSQILIDNGSAPTFLNDKEFTKLIVSEKRKWAELIKSVSLD